MSVPRPRALLGLAAVPVMSAAAYEFRPDNTSIALAIALALGGGALVGVSAHALPLAQPECPSLNPARANLPLAAAGVVLLTLTTEASGRVLGLTWLYGLSVHMQQMLLWGGLALLALGLGGWPLAAKRPALNANRLSLLMIALIALLALVLRIGGLDTTIRSSVDENHWTDGIRFLSIDDRIELLRTATTHFPTTLVYTHWTYAAVELFGRTLSGLRLTNAVLGALNVLAVYGLASALFNRRIGVIAALILATFPPHLHFSRVAMPQMADTLFGTAALMFAARGCRWNRRLDWSLAGIALGLTQYFYEGGRLLFPPLLLAWSAFVIVTPQLKAPSLSEQASLLKERFRVMALRGLGVMWLAAVIVAIPVYYAMIAGGRLFLNRLEGSGVASGDLLALVNAGDIGGLLRQFLNPLLVYVHQPELRPDFYGGTQPMVLTLFVPLLLIGAFALLRRHPAIIIPLWALAAVLGNGLIRENTLYNRYILAFPALAIMMAVGLVWVWSLLNPHLPQGQQGTRRWFFSPRQANGVRQGERLGVRVMFTVLIAVIQAAYYFGPHLAQFNVQLRETKPYRDGVEAVLRAADLPARTRLVIIDSPKNDGLVLQNWLDFVAPGQMQIRVLDTSEADDALLQSWPHDAPYAFFIPPGDEATVTRVRRYFALQAPVYSPYNIPARYAYALYFAPTG